MWSFRTRMFEQTLRRNLSSALSSLRQNYFSSSRTAHSAALGGIHPFKLIKRLPISLGSFTQPSARELYELDSRGQRLQPKLHAKQPGFRSPRLGIVYENYRTPHQRIHLDDIGVISRFILQHPICYGTNWNRDIVKVKKLRPALTSTKSKLQT